MKKCRPSLRSLRSSSHDASASMRSTSMSASGSMDSPSSPFSVDGDLATVGASSQSSTWPSSVSCSTWMTMRFCVSDLRYVTFVFSSSLRCSAWLGPPSLTSSFVPVPSSEREFVSGTVSAEVRVDGVSTNSTYTSWPSMEVPRKALDGGFGGGTAALGDSGASSTGALAAVGGGRVLVEVGGSRSIRGGGGLVLQLPAHG
mmetsp:Transcript_26776/g.77932  ORF Transcript_26776/g.77932 Transcript_26776/m.77932 type:complete len:201 (-) Transcript_26776:986-1588(-)